MITVIVYHCICLWSKGGWFVESAQDSTVLACICALLNNVHIYVFAFVSGFLFYYLKYERNKYNKPLKDIKKRANRLLKPYVLVSLVWVIPFPPTIDIYYNYTIKWSCKYTCNIYCKFCNSNDWFNFNFIINRIREEKNILQKRS